MTEKATFAAGCFWGAEEAYRTQRGVLATRVGYMGGHSPNPTTHDLHHGGFAEVVEVTFDPAQISYAELLDIFWRTHDPTVANPGGLERSAIFFHGEAQRAAIEASRQKAQAAFARRIATDVTPASDFYLADEHHQLYLYKQGLATCETAVDEDR